MNLKWQFYRPLINSLFIKKACLYSKNNISEPIRLVYHHCIQEKLRYVLLARLRYTSHFFFWPSLGQMADLTSSLVHVQLIKRRGQCYRIHIAQSNQILKLLLAGEGKHFLYIPQISVIQHRTTSQTKNIRKVKTVAFTTRIKFRRG